MQGNLTIVGVKQFQGTIEGSPTVYDHTKLIILLPFPRARAETNLGYDGIEATYGKADNYKKFAGRKYPLVAECEYEVTTKGIDIFDVTLPNPNQQQATPQK